MRPQTQRPQKEVWNLLLWHRKLKLLQWHHHPQGGLSSSEWHKIIILKMLKWVILHFSVSLPRVAEESKCLDPQSVITSSTPTDSSPTGSSPAESQTTSSTSSLSPEELSSNTTTDLVWWGFIWSAGVFLCLIFCLILFFKFCLRSGVEKAQLCRGLPKAGQGPTASTNALPFSSCHVTCSTPARAQGQQGRGAPDNLQV